jgi:putative alpha-1,2-mannosidase
MANITEDGKYYSGYDKQVHASDGHDFYVDDSLWDTYRSEHPLELLLSPSRQLDMVRSYVRMYEQGGWMPRDPTVDGPGDWMIGNHSASLIADTYTKGYKKPMRAFGRMPRKPPFYPGTQDHSHRSTASTRSADTFLHWPKARRRVLRTSPRSGARPSP